MDHYHVDYSKLKANLCRIREQDIVSDPIFSFSDRELTFFPSCHEVIPPVGMDQQKKNSGRIILRRTSVVVEGAVKEVIYQRKMVRSTQLLIARRLALQVVDVFNLRTFPD